MGGELHGAQPERTPCAGLWLREQPRWASILGATEANGRWVLDGLEFPADPPTWVTDVIGDHAVLPYPDGLDTKAFSVGDARHVAVVRIPPVATPPCNTGGRVYERVSGRTIPVRDPTRLAKLFSSKETRRESARRLVRNGPLSPRYSEARLDLISMRRTSSSALASQPRRTTLTLAVGCSVSSSSSSWRKRSRQQSMILLGA